MYIINKILKSHHRAGIIEYLVDWEGCGSEEPSWVRSKDILELLLKQNFHAEYHHTTCSLDFYRAHLIYRDYKNCSVTNTKCQALSLIPVRFIPAEPFCYDCYFVLDPVSHLWISVSDPVYPEFDTYLAPDDSDYWICPCCSCMLRINLYLLFILTLPIILNTSAFVFNNSSIIIELTFCLPTLYIILT